MRFRDSVTQVEALRDVAESERQVDPPGYASWSRTSRNLFQFFHEVERWLTISTVPSFQTFQVALDGPDWWAGTNFNAGPFGTGQSIKSIIFRWSICKTSRSWTHLEILMQSHTTCSCFHWSIRSFVFKGRRLRCNIARSSSTSSRLPREATMWSKFGCFGQVSEGIFCHHCLIHSCWHRWIGYITAIQADKNMLTLATCACSLAWLLTARNGDRPPVASESFRFRRISLSTRVTGVYYLLLRFQEQQHKLELQVEWWDPAATLRRQNQTFYSKAFCVRPQSFDNYTTVDSKGLTMVGHAFLIFQVITLVVHLTKASNPFSPKCSHVLVPKARLSQMEMKMVQGKQAWSRWGAAQIDFVDEKVLAFGKVIKIGLFGVFNCIVVPLLVPFSNEERVDTGWCWK